MPIPRCSSADPVARVVGSLAAFVRLSRPHFLLGGVLLHGLGAAMAPTFELRPFLWSQAMVTSTQLTAHYANEYADRESDRLVANRTFFSGGSGVLAGGSLPPAVAVRAAVTTTILALVGAGVLALDAPAAALVVIPAVLVSWLYSIPPVRLLSTGWGELATSIVVGVGVPLAGLLGQGGKLGGGFWSIVVPLAAIHLAMMLVFAVPDIESDRRAEKLVLAVRLGQRRSLRVASVLWLGGLLWLVSTSPSRGPWIVGGVTVAALAAVGSVRSASSTSTNRHAWSTALGVAVLVASAGGALLSVLG